MVLYQSLAEHSRNFHLYIFAFDESVSAYLRSCSLQHMTVISQDEFEDEELLAIKGSRTRAEYCWTCTPSTILYCINTFDLQNCTYIDADMRFYADPQILWNEMGSNSVLITEHRYTPAYDQTDSSGKYCVQFVGFRKDERGMEVLTWWRNACLDWCYARTEDGKFGDQKYLDDWTSRFEGVHELQHLGGGIAPWNVQQYTFVQKGSKIQGTEISSGKIYNVIFYHFHGLTFYKKGVVSFTSSIYEVSLQSKKIFYFPYLVDLNKASDDIIKTGKIVDPNGEFDYPPVKPLNYLRKVKSYLLDVRSSFRNINGSQHRFRKLHHHYYWKSLFK